MTPLPPPRVPDHELIRRIGRGGYGEVWLARSVTGSFRAVKIVHRGSFDHDRPFEREYEGIRKFEPVSRTHDSQVDILHVGRSDDCFYYVMELADDQATGGQINPEAYAPRTLKSDLVFHGRLAFEECVRIGLALATALEHLHAHGLVHRDVKPSNIIFVNGTPKLADIGLVTGVDATRSHVGTEGFAAPEGPGTVQADLYSLGKVLYELATGKDRQEFPDLPTQLRELPDREGLMELNAVIARACRHDPKDRYASAAAMRADLELLQSGKSLARLHRVERRLRFVTRAGGMMALLIMLVAVGWLYQRAQTGEARRLAEHNRQLADDKSRLADEKAKLGEENRERLVRLNVANGVRIIEKEPANATLWFAEALRFATNRPEDASIHRMRLQQMIERLAVPVQVFPHGQFVTTGVFNNDERLIATGTVGGEIAVWDVASGVLQWSQKADFPILQARFSRAGGKLFVASTHAANSGRFEGWGRKGAGVIDVATGDRVFWEEPKTGLLAGLSPDDRWLVLTGSNHVIHVVDFRDGKTVSKLVGHTDEITALSFGGDGELLASASRDKTVRVWRLPSGEPMGHPLKHDTSLRRIALSRDGKRLVAMGPPWSNRANGSNLQGLPIMPKENWSAQVWDTRSSAKLGAPMTALVSEQCVLAFMDAAGKRLFIGGEPQRDAKIACFIDVETREELVLPATTGSTSIRCWAFSPDGKSVARGDDHGTIRIFDAKSGELLMPPINHSGWVESLEFSRDGNRILATRESGKVVLYQLKRPASAGETRFDAAILKRERTWFPHALNNRERRFSIPLADGTVRVVDLQRLVELHTLRPAVTTNLPALTSTYNGRLWAARGVASGLNPGNATPESIELWRELNGSLTQSVIHHPDPVSSMRFDSTGTHLITASGDLRVRYWRTIDGGLERTVAPPDGTNGGMILFPDGKTALLFRDGNPDAQLFDLTAEKRYGQKIPLGGLRFLMFARDSERFATATPDNCGRIWSTRTGEPLTPPFRQGGDIYYVGFSPDHRHVVTAGLGPTKIWDASTGELAVPALGDESARVATWSTDGRFVVVPGHERGVRVWDAATGEMVTPLIMCEGYLRFATMVDNRLITLSDPDLLQAWELKETKLPVALLSDYAQLLSGKRFSASGFPISLKPRELADLLQSLRARAPELFHQRESEQPR